MRNGIGEGFEFFIGGMQLCRTFDDAFLQFFIQAEDLLLRLLTLRDIGSKNCNSLCRREGSHSIPSIRIFPWNLEASNLSFFHSRAEALFQNCSHVFWKHRPDIVSDKILRCFPYF